MISGIKQSFQRLRYPRSTGGWAPAERNMDATPIRRKILYVGDVGFGSTSNYRFAAMKRIGQDAVSFDPATVLSSSRILSKLRSRYPLGPLVARANQELLRLVREHKPEIVWFDKPLVFTPDTIQAIRASGALPVCYNQDNPFGPRNDGCWMQFYRAHKFFDLHCLFRTVDIPRY